MSQKNKIVSLMILGVIFLRLYLDKLESFCDLAVYYAAGQKILLHHTVYDVPGHFQYKYAPWISLLFGYLLTPFEFDSLKYTFHFLSLVAWLFYIVWMAKQVQSRISAPFIFLLFLINHLATELIVGQVNLWALASFAAMYVMLNKKTLLGDFWAGFLFCFAFSVKLSLLIAIPYLIFRRHWMVLVSASFAYLLFGVGVVSLTSGVDFTISEHWAWIASLTKSSRELLDFHNNISILGMLMKASISFQVASLIWGAFLGAFVLIQWKWRKSTPLFQLGLQGASMVLLSPIAWQNWALYYFPALLMQADTWVEYFMRSKRTQILGFLILAIMIILFQSFWHVLDYGPRTFSFFLILLGLILSENKKRSVVAR
jgi:Glycosyltransferase family 87